MKRAGDRGFTLAELLGTVVVMGVILSAVVVLLSFLLGTGGGSNHGAAMRQAKDWALNMGFTNTRVDCATAATKKNAMVPCSVAVPIKDGLPVIYGLECGPAISLTGQEGCRVTSTPALPVGQQPR